MDDDKDPFIEDELPEDIDADAAMDMDDADADDDMWEGEE